MLSVMATRGVVPVVLGLLGTLMLAAPARAVDWGPREAAYPAPGGDPRANVRLDEIGSKLIGIHDDFSPAIASHDDQMRKFSGAGLDVARRTLSWTTHEWRRSREDSAQWAESRSFYESALAQGLVPLFVITGSPHWATDGCVAPLAWGPDGQAVPPCDRPPKDTAEMNGEWQEFVAKAAQRFPEAVFEIWNEPNIEVFWNPQPNPERWAKLVRLATDAIDAVDPGIPVLGCACAGLTPGVLPDGSADPVGKNHVHDRNIGTGEFLRRAYAARDSIRGRLDGLSFHFFPQGFQPFAPFDFGAGSHFAELVERVRAAAAAGGEAGIPIWIDEVGYWTRDVRGPEFVVSEEQKAEGLGQLARIVAGTPDLKALVIHRGVDGSAANNTSQGHVRQSSFGLLYRGDREGKPPLGAKPAYCRLAAMSGIPRPDPLCPLLVAPETTITKAPPPTGASPDVEFGFAASGGEALFECSLDGAAPVRCSSPVSFELLAPGRHTFTVRAYRLDGTQDETPARHAFDVDAGLNAPVAVIESGPPALGNSRSATFEFSADVPGSSFECSLDGGGFQPCSSPEQLDSVADGAHGFRVRAYRLREHPGPAAAHPFRVDTRAPTVSISSAPAQIQSGQSSELSFSADEPATFGCRLDGGGAQACVSPLRLTAGSPGPHSVGIKATDSAGNTGREVVHAYVVITGSPSGPAPDQGSGGQPQPPDSAGSGGRGGPRGSGGSGRGRGPGTGGLTPARPSSKRCDIAGTRGDDVLWGTRKDDRICGRGGNDVIRGRGGNDVLLGGRGHDVIMGGAGNDRIRGSRGRDRLMGSRGRDFIAGGKGPDRLTGGPGRDILRGGRGKNRLRP